MPAWRGGLGTGPGQGAGREQVASADAYPW
jgi:hypothetical protein